MSTFKTKKTDFSIYKNATKIGSGVWFVNHLKSFHIEKEEDIISLFRDISLLQIYFSCNTCKDHLNEFCKKFPPKEVADEDVKDFREGKRPENLAKWLVNAHNNASQERFLASGANFKPNDVKYFFDTLGQTPCEKDCDKPLSVESIKIVEEIKKKPTLRLRVVRTLD